MLGTVGEINMNSWQCSPMDSYTWTHKSWRINLNLNSSVTCAHWMSTKGFAKSNDRQEWMVRDKGRHAVGMHWWWWILLNTYISLYSRPGLQNILTASLQRGKPLPHSMSVLDMTSKNLMVRLSNILKLWGMRSTPSLPLFSGPPFHGVLAPDRVRSMGQIELRTNKWLMLNWIIKNRTVWSFNSK